MAKPTTTIAFALVAALAGPNFLLADTTTLRKGPPCKVEKSVDKHLVQIYVTPPKANAKYTPGRLQVFLRKEHPDYLYVPLEAKKLKDGRLHVQIAISPNKQAGYLIAVLDHHPKERLIAFWQELSKIKTVKPASKKELTMTTSTLIQRYRAAESAKELQMARRDIVQDLLSRYGAPGDTAAHLDPNRGYKFSQRADRLLREWNPIFFHADQLRALLGDPQRKRESVLVYSFTVGPIQKHWEFRLDARRVIVGVAFIPGE